MNKRGYKDKYKSANEQTFKYAFNEKWITQKDYDFYLDVLRKRVLSEKQEKWELDINRRIIKGTRRNPNISLSPNSKNETT